MKAGNASAPVRFLDQCDTFRAITVGRNMPSGRLFVGSTNGARPTGNYWGGGGEQINMLSRNLNFTTPLIKPQGRGGWGVGFNLSYNSQNWRKDPGAIRQLGRDVGYGYGWKVQAGSLTPVYSGYLTLHHLLIIDSTGAETIWIKIPAGSGRRRKPSTPPTTPIRKKSISRTGVSGSSAHNPPAASGTPEPNIRP